MLYKHKRKWPFDGAFWLDSRPSFSSQRKGGSKLRDATDIGTTFPRSLPPSSAPRPDNKGTLFRG